MRVNRSNKAGRGGFGWLALAAIWLGAFAATTLGPAAADASPSRFVYAMCDPALPGGPADARFVANPGAPFAATNSCGQPGGYIGISQTGATAGTYSYWSITVPVTPGGSIESLSASASSCSGAGVRAFVMEQGWPGNCSPESQRTYRHGGRLALNFWMFLGCDGNYAPGCQPGSGVGARFFSATQVDPVAPAVGELKGSLLSGGTIRGDQTVGVESKDQGGGLSKVEIYVNDLPAAQPTVGNCNVFNVDNVVYKGPATITATPCPKELVSNWTLDTSAMPFTTGTNTVKVCASDFSTVGDPNRTCTPARSVTVNNSCTESAVPGGQSIEAQFTRSRDQEVTVSYRRPAKVVGELTNQAGDTISGATICVQMQTQGSGSGLRTVATTTTDAQGHFTYTVPPGPNRKVSMGYRHNSFQVARSLTYSAHIKPTFKLQADRVSPDAKLRMWGKIPGRYGAGRVVTIQGGSLHGPWQTFEEVTTDRFGRFRSSYTFSDTDVRITYRLRAVVPRQRGLPWEKGHSKPVLVEVRPG